MAVCALTITKTVNGGLAAENARKTQTGCLPTAGRAADNVEQFSKYKKYK